MPRPSRPWFRFYVEACHDPKLRRLDPAERWLWVAVLAIARQSCLPGLLVISERENYSDADIGDFAAMDTPAVKAGMRKLERAGMVERHVDLRCWEVVNWAERQFESDDVTARVQRSRERRSNVAKPFPETPPETETDSDTDPCLNRGLVREARPQSVENNKGALKAARQETFERAQAAQQKLRAVGE